MLLLLLPLLLLVWLLLLLPPLLLLLLLLLCPLLLLLWVLLMGLLLHLPWLLPLLTWLKPPDLYHKLPATPAGHLPCMQRRAVVSWTSRYIVCKVAVELAPCALHANLISALGSPLVYLQQLHKHADVAEEAQLVPKWVINHPYPTGLFPYLIWCPFVLPVN
jgi:hypothetical protein